MPPTDPRLDEVERVRILDFARRLRSVRHQALLALAVVLAACTQTFGAAVLLPMPCLLGAFWLLGRMLPGSARPERPLLACLAVVQLAIVGSIALAAHHRLDALGLLILPAAAACILLPRRLMVLAVGWSVLVMTAAAFAIDARGLLETPPKLFLPLGVMLCVALPAAMIRRLEIASRDTAMIDTLTGALGRVALETRLAELQAQVHALPLRVGVIMADLDHFKLVNDELGHEAGDGVLRETVARMRAVLGPLTPVYRVGGEEFAVLMAGAEESEVQGVAESLRQAVGARPMAGRAVTMSFGIAAGTLDAHPISRILEVADQALYRAKRAGRDRVVAAHLSPLRVVPASPGESATHAAAHGPAAGECSELLLSERRVVMAPAPVALGHDNGNWFVRGDFERDHLRESAHALSRTHHGALGFVFIALVASIPWMGWQLMVPAAFTTVAYHLAERRIQSSRHPEFVLGGAWLLVQLSIFAGALIASPAEPYMLVLFTPMMIGMTAVYPTRGVVVNSMITIGLVALARPDLVAEAPGLLGVPILIVIGIALMSSVTGRSAIEHRTKAVVDPLTGLLTRAALRSRLAEIGQEAQASAATVSVIAFDIDHFKALNDEHGHATGDDALRAVGETTRRHLHALEWAFRLGGDEFVVVVPEALGAAGRLAERLRVALAELSVDGTGLTGSFGVATSDPGEAFSFETVCRRADGALYEAKRAGRNRVAVAPAGASPPARAATVLLEIA